MCLALFVLEYKEAEVHMDLFIKESGIRQPGGLLEFVKSQMMFLGTGYRWADSNYGLVSEGGV